MHDSRLVGGLISLAALLTLLLVPATILAMPSPVTAPAPGAGPGPAAPGSTASSSASSPWTDAGVAPDVERLRLTPAQRRARRLESERRLVLRVARRQLGVPYVYGGASRGGFDCSGLTLYVYQRLGRDLPHGATDQSRRGSRVSLRRLEVGDLVFYGDPSSYYHVGIYASRGRVIHAPHSGAVVRYDRVGDASAARRLIGS